MKTKQIQDFDAIFNFAYNKYGISWNEANDVFFGNAFDYGKMSEATLGLEIFAYLGTKEISEKLGFDLDKKIDEVGKVTGLFTKEEVLSLSNYEKSLIITAEYFESINVSGEVLINSQ
tara:strand:- start:256 stop:609 length:354 start_codon:yes stop_codon:yes gene_type:complete